MKHIKYLVMMSCVIIFMLCFPVSAGAYTVDATGTRQYFPVFEENFAVQSYAHQDEASYQITYHLGGGKNSRINRNVLYESELPYTLEVPAKEGYNFAGWYTDKNYRHKITRITKKNKKDITLYAKWTEPIDNYMNVEMYSYHTNNLLYLNQKELRQCSYNFVDDIEIPGMPSTRERDYIDNYINSSSLCMQGLCFTPDYILMTAYSEEKNVPGALMVFDRQSGEYLVTLGMNKESHLGGIAFDGENLWVCHSNSTTLERISYQYIQLIANDAPGYCIDASAISDEYRLKNTPSCITYYGGRIWVASYNKMFHSKMYSYSYDPETDSIAMLGSYNIPSKVQGVAFDSNGSVYLSTSLGRNKSSYLKVYNSLLSLNNYPGNPYVKVEMPPCSEEIAIADNNLYILFESASFKYFEGTDGKGKSTAPIDKLLAVDMASIW